MTVSQLLTPIAKAYLAQNGEVYMYELKSLAPFELQNQEISTMSETFKWVKCTIFVVEFNHHIKLKVSII